MNEIGINKEPRILYSKPKFIQMHNISDEQLTLLELFSNGGFQGNIMWVAIGAVFGAVTGAVVFFYKFFFNINELSMANKLAGFVDTTIFASGIIISGILCWLSREHKVSFKKIIKKIREQESS